MDLLGFLVVNAWMVGFQQSGHLHLCSNAAVCTLASQMIDMPVLTFPLLLGLDYFMEACLPQSYLPLRFRCMLPRSLACASMNLHSLISNARACDNDGRDMCLHAQGVLTRAGFDEQTSRVLREAGLTDQQIKQVIHEYSTHCCAIAPCMQVFKA